MSPDKPRRISAGHYVYKGFKVDHAPPLGWEAVDEHGCGFAHSGTLGGTIALIDWELKKEKENENA